MIVKRTMGACAAWVLGVALVAATSARAAEDGSVVQEVLGILKERGIVDQEEYERLALENASYEHAKSESLLSKIRWSGDARLRLRTIAHIHRNRHERARGQLVEMPASVAPLKLHKHKSLVLVLLAEVDPLDASRIHYRRVLA